MSISSEARPVARLLLDRNNHVESLRKFLMERTEVLKSGQGGRGAVGGQYDSKRVSPGGPDPKHHSRNLISTEQVLQAKPITDMSMWEMHIDD